MPATQDTIDRIKTVLRTSLKLDSSVEFEDEMPLAGGEYDLDSLDILLIITNIEKEFGLRIREGTMNRSAFATIRTLADFVEQLRS
jgi:acyl carrier protein